MIEKVYKVTVTNNKTIEKTNPNRQKLESARGQYAFLVTEVKKIGILLEHGAIPQDVFNKVQLEKETAGTR